MRIIVSVASNSGQMEAGDCFGGSEFCLPIEVEAKLFDDSGRLRDINAFALQYLAPAFVNALEHMRAIQESFSFGEFCK